MTGGEAIDQLRLLENEALVYVKSFEWLPSATFALVQGATSFVGVTFAWSCFCVPSWRLGEQKKVSS